MLRKFLKAWLINTLALALTGLAFNGLKISFSIFDFLAVTLFLTILIKISRPIFNLLFMPLNLITFGLFGYLHSVLALGITIYFSDSLTIQKFYFSGFKWDALELKPFILSPFLSLIIASIIFNLLVKLLRWVLKAR